MSWPEACLQILRRLNVTVTPEELVDDYKSSKQKSDAKDEDYVLQMHDRSGGLSAVLGRKEALLYAASNMIETRIRKRLSQRIRDDKITTFNDMYAEVVELNEDYVGRQVPTSSADHSKSTP